MFSPFMRFTSSTNRERSYEHRFFPIAPSVTLHTHVQSEGSPSTVPKITIFQNPGDPCRVTSFQIRIHWAGSVAKSVLRLRASVVVWAIGMFALLMREQVRQQRALGKLNVASPTPASDNQKRRALLSRRWEGSRCGIVSWFGRRHLCLDCSLQHRNTCSSVSTPITSLCCRQVLAC